jgi:hypothetical protein
MKQPSFADEFSALAHATCEIVAGDGLDVPSLASIQLRGGRGVKPTGSERST